MNDPIISTYWKIINAVRGSLPSGGAVFKSIYHIGRAANEINKGMSCLRRKNKLEKNKAKSRVNKITIE